MTLPSDLRDGVRGLADGLYPVDHRSQQHFVARERFFSVRSMPVDGLDQLNDVKQEVRSRFTDQQPQRALALGVEV